MGFMLLVVMGLASLVHVETANATTTRIGFWLSYRPNWEFKLLWEIFNGGPGATGRLQPPQPF